MMAMTTKSSLMVNKEGRGRITIDSYYRKRKKKQGVSPIIQTNIYAQENRIVEGGPTITVISVADRSGGEEGKKINTLRDTIVRGGGGLTQREKKKM